MIKSLCSSHERPPPQDLVGALAADEIASTLDLTSIRDRPWQIQACSAKQGTGLKEGMEWMMKQVK